MTHFQDLDEFGILLHTKSYVYEFFSGSKVFEFNEMQKQIKNAAVNQEHTIMLAQETVSTKNLIVKVSNTKELKAYTDAIKNPQTVNVAIKGLKPLILT